MSMNVDVNSINLLKTIIDCRLIVDININSILNIKNLNVDEMNFAN